MLVRAGLAAGPLFGVVHLPFVDPDADMDRGVLACRVRPSAAGAPGVYVGTVHLESPEGQGALDNCTTRRRQCRVALAALERLVAADPTAAAAVLAGDFNATRGEAEHRWVAAGLIPRARPWCSGLD